MVAAAAAAAAAVAEGVFVCCVQAAKGRRSILRLASHLASRQASRQRRKEGSKRARRLDSQVSLTVSWDRLRGVDAGVAGRGSGNDRATKEMLGNPRRVGVTTGHSDPLSLTTAQRTQSVNQPWLGGPCLITAASSARYQLLPAFDTIRASTPVADWGHGECFGKRTHSRVIRESVLLILLAKGRGASFIPGSGR